MKKIRGTVEAWESGELGMNPTTQAPVNSQQEKEMDDALGLIPVSIRLQKTLVEELKVMARKSGIGYQPFIRQILSKYVANKKEN